MTRIAIAATPTSVCATNGDALPIRVWSPPRPRRVVVALHGMVTHAGWFAPVAAHLVERGVAVIAPDRRGNGLARSLGGCEDPALLIADVVAVVDHARTRCDDVTLLVWCGSANFAIPAALHARIDRVVLASPGLVPLPHLAARFRAAVAEDGTLPLHFDPAADFTDDPETRARIDADPLYLRRVPVGVRVAWGHLGPLARAALADLPVPARALLTRTDRMIDIPATVDLLRDIPVTWAPGGHGFILEPGGARVAAEVLSA